MKLLRIVKVGNITNLSDARYCAGMGVHLMGFNTIDSRPGYVRAETFREFRGWFTGPSIVAEVYGLNAAEVLQNIMRNYLPDFAELSVDELPLVDIPSLPLIIASGGIPVNQLLDHLAPRHNQVAYVVVDEAMPTDGIKHLAGYYPVLLRLAGPLTHQHLSLPVKGFALTGSSEERPGLKSYNTLADVLEQLSED